MNMRFCSVGSSAENIISFPSAGFSLRTVRNDKEILIGASDMYRPVCKACYYKNNLIENEKEEAVNKETEIKIN